VLDSDVVGLGSTRHFDQLGLALSSEAQKFEESAAMNDCRFDGPVREGCGFAFNH
jgi:hypothetical protein